MFKKFAAAALAALAIGMAAPAAQSQVKIKISSPTVNDASQEWARLFKERMDKRAPGKVAVEFYPPTSSAIFRRLLKAWRSAPLKW